MLYNIIVMVEEQVTPGSVLSIVVVFHFDSCLFLSTNFRIDMVPAMFVSKEADAGWRVDGSSLDLVWHLPLMNATQKRIIFNYSKSTLPRK